MPLKQKILALWVSLSVLLAIVELVRRRKLREEYSVLWLVTGSVLLVFALRYDVLQGLTRFFGVALPTSTVFFGGIMFLLAVTLHLSVMVSRLTDQNQRLVQRMALLEAHIEDRLSGVPETGEPPIPGGAHGPGSREIHS